MLRTRLRCLRYGSIVDRLSASPPNIPRCIPSSRTFTINSVQPAPRSLLEKKRGRGQRAQRASIDPRSESDGFAASDHHEVQTGEENPGQSSQAVQDQSRTSVREQSLTAKDIRRFANLPKAEDYNLPRDPLDMASKLLGSADIELRKVQTTFSPPRVINATRVDARCVNHIEIGEVVLNITGDGRTKAAASDAANMHTICELHNRDLLKEILPNGRYHLQTNTLGWQRSESNAKLDIIDYAALHDCSPIIHCQKSHGKKRIFRAHVSIPELALDAYGAAATGESAVMHACIAAKALAQKRHSEEQQGKLIVKDFTQLNSESAGKFVSYYARRKKLQLTRESETVPNLDESSRWSSSIKVDGAIEYPDPIKGILMRSKPDSMITAHLAAALKFKLQDPEIWADFVVEMKQGNGEILAPLNPIDISLGEKALSEISSTIQKVTAADERGNFRDSDLDTAIMRKEMRQRNLERSNSALASYKSEVLKKNLARYRADPHTEMIRHQRSELPMVQHRKDVLKLVNENEFCVVVGATGSGKTTQLPQLILEDMIERGTGGNCNIICTQPRRIAAVSVAQRVAVERNEPLGQTVGYTVRFDTRPPQFGGSVHYCTTGILLRQLQDGHKEALEGISHVIIDEVHERDIQIDFLLATLKQVMSERNAAGLPKIKVILMSATIDTTLFCEYFGKGYDSGRCPDIEIPGRMFPVTQHFLDDMIDQLRKEYPKQIGTGLDSPVTRKYLQSESKFSMIPAPASPTSAKEEDSSSAAIDWKSKSVIDDDGELATLTSEREVQTPLELMGMMIAHLIKTTNTGSILVFLPGLQEILGLEKVLREENPLGVNIEEESNIKLYTLHSAVPQMQKEVFENLGPGKRKIILSTNIAETSITIPDVVYVVDSSRQRELQYNKSKRLSGLVTAWTSLSNAKQRAGRAGRVQHGHYYTLASKARYESFAVSPTPEILRTDLQELCLQIKCMGIQNVWGFLRTAIQPPALQTVSAAMASLQAVGALDEKMNMTSLGHLLSNLPLPPSLGKMVLLGAIFKCLDPIIILAAASTGKDPFLSPPLKRQEAFDIRQKWARGTQSDHLATINAFQAWREIKGSSIRRHGRERDFAIRNFLHHNTLVTIDLTAKQILSTLEKAGIIESGAHNTSQTIAYGTIGENIYSDSVPLQTAIATAGFYPNVAVRSSQGRVVQLRTLEDQTSMIFPWSLAAPVSSTGHRYGPFRPEDVAPAGTVFTFSEKTQADAQSIHLRGISKTTHLAVVLFGGKATEAGPVVSIDDWIRLYIQGSAKWKLLSLKQLLDDYLARTFARLRVNSQRDTRLLSTSKGFLGQDPVREPLINGITSALQLSAPQEFLVTGARTGDIPNDERPAFRRSRNPISQMLAPSRRSRYGQSQTDTRPEQPHERPVLEDIFKAWVK